MFFVGFGRTRELRTIFPLAERRRGDPNRISWFPMGRTLALCTVYSTQIFPL